MTDDEVVRLRVATADVVELALGPVVVLAADGTLVASSRFADDLLGDDGDHLRPDWVERRMAEPDRQRLLRRLAEGANEPVRTSTALVMCRDEPRLIEWRYRLIERAAPIGMLASVVDVGRPPDGERRRVHPRQDDAGWLANVGTAYQDLRTGEVAYSDAVYRILEIDRSEHPDATAAGLALMRPDDRRRVTEALARLVESHELMRMDVSVQLASGTEKSVRLSGRVEVDAAGEPYCVLGWIQDVSVRSHAALGLRRALARHEHAQSLAELGTWTRDLESGELTFSDEMVRVFEIGREEMEAGGLMRVVHDADRPEMAAALRSLYDDQVPFDVQVRLLMSDGRIKHVRATGKIHDDADGPLTAVGATQDITATVEAAERLQAMTDLLQEAESVAQIGSWERDLRTGELRWSDEAYRLFELDPETQPPRYGAFLELVHPDDRELADAAYRSSVEHREPYDMTHRLMMPDGRIKWVRERGHTRYDGDEPVLSLGTVQDITRTYLAELAVRELNADLERRIEERTTDLAAALASAEAASRAKSAFLAAMSHELRTPLNAVLGYAQLLEIDDRLPDDLRANVSTIRSSGGRLLELIGNVIDLARVESGAVDLQIARLRLADVVEACVQRVRTSERARTVTMRIDPSVGALAVDADRVRLGQVLDHLVSNAVTYNRLGGSVVISGSSSGDGFVRALVTDTGIGFDPAHGAELFEPFNRLGQERGPAEGTGIGLAICRRLVLEMGGDIGFSSVPGEGSTFWIELPGTTLDV